MKKYLLTGIAGLAWLTAILLLYFTGHKPLTPALAAAMAQAGWRLLIALALISLAGGIGAFFFRRGEAEGWHLLSLLAIQAGLGFGAVGLGVLALGATIGLRAWLLGLPVLLLVLLRPWVKSWWSHWRALVALWRESDMFGRWVGGLTGAAMLCALAVALAPPLAYDALVYHLTMPAAYLRAGRVEYLPWIIMTGLPQGTEMLYTLAMGLGGGQAAAVIGWLFGPLAAAGLLGFLRCRFDARTAWAGLAALLAGYSMITALAWGYVDWPGMLFGLALLMLLDSWRQSGRGADLAWAGVFAGLAFGAKYTAGILAIGGGLALLDHIWRRKAALVPAALRFGLPALAVILPWLLKNLLATGNPLYPFFFPSGAITPVRLPIFQNAPPWGSWLDVVFLPFRATYIGIDGAEGYEWSIGPLLLGLGILAVIGFRSHFPERKATLEGAALLSGLCWILWAIGNQRSGYLVQSRMYFSFFPALATLAAIGFRQLDALQPPLLESTHMGTVRFGRIAAALVLLVLGLNTFQIAVNTASKDALRAVLGLTSEAEYLAGNLGWYAPAMQAVRELPAGSQTLLLLEPRSYYCAPACRPDEILDRWKRDSQAYQDDGQAIIKAWKVEGFTHVLLLRTGLEYFREHPDVYHSTDEMLALDKFVKTLPAPKSFGGAYELYSLP